MKEIRTPYVYSVDEWNEDKKMWVSNLRFYAVYKSLITFDLRPIPGHRKNAKLIAILT